MMLSAKPGFPAPHQAMYAGVQIVLLRCERSYLNLRPSCRSTVISTRTANRLDSPYVGNQEQIRRSGRRSYALVKKEYDRLLPHQLAA
jgi:hypothetical protein